MAGGLLYGVLIANDRKMFLLPVKALSGRKLRYSICKNEGFVRKNYGDPRRDTPGYWGAVEGPKPRLRLSFNTSGFEANSHPH